MINIKREFYEKVSHNKKVYRSNDINLAVKISWIKIFKNMKNNNIIGISENGDWVLNNSNSLKILNNIKSFMYCINMLEVPYVEIENEIKNDFKGCKNLSVENIFPFVEIIKFIFEYNHSDYWVELSFDWYDSLCYESKYLLKDSLNIALKNKRISQKNRHKISREVFKI